MAAIAVKKKSKTGLWPTIRALILLLNFLLIINHLVFTDQNRERSGISDFHIVLKSHESAVLAQCEKEAFDLRNERQRNHKSPFQDSLCSAVPLGATAASLWNDHARQLFQASIHPLDTTHQAHAGWTRQLQALLAPHFLQRGLRMSPSFESLQKILKIVQQKLLHPTLSPPLQVAVLGGSISQGKRCNIVPTQLLPTTTTNLPLIEGLDCAWPFRLQRILDHFLGENMIHIHNIEGSHPSNTSIPLLDLPQYAPLQERGFDVIINAHSTKDNYYAPSPQGNNATKDYTFFYQNCFERAQQFIRSSFPCHGNNQDDPIIVFVDDYLGNQHNVILAELTRLEAIDTLAQWYPNVASISPAQVVRRLVYANTEEEVFTARWNDYTKPKVQFGMPGHIHIAWTIAYAMLEMTVEFCEEETSRQGDHDELEKNTAVENNNTTQKHHQEHHDAALKFVRSNALELIQQEVPPRLDSRLKVEEVAPSWRKDATKRHQGGSEFCTKK